MKTSNPPTKMNSKNFQKLDVRPLLRKGKEPFPVIKAKVEALGEEEGLELIAPFLPAPLIEMLTSQGFQHRIDQGDDGSWTVWFWR